MSILTDREIAIPVGADFVRRLAPMVEQLVAAWPRDEQGRPVLSEQAVAASAAVGPVLVEALSAALEDHLQVVVELARQQPSLSAEHILDLAGQPAPEVEGMASLHRHLLWLEALCRGDLSRIETAAPTIKPEPSPAIVREGYATIPTVLALDALVRAVHDARTGKGWDDFNGTRVPTHTTGTNKKSKTPGAVYVTVRGHDGKTEPAASALDDLWAQVGSLDDLTSDVLLVCLAACTQSGGDAWINVDAILDARGIRRMQYQDEPGNWQHGHRTEDRRAVGRALAQLDSLWLEIQNVEVIHGGKRRKPRRLTLESRAVALLDKITQHDLDGGTIVLAARVTLGTWANAYQELELVQRGLLAQKALAYDPSKRQPEKRLAKYLAFHYRYNAGSATFKRSVGDLLEVAGIEPDAARPQRTRARLDLALDRLREDAVIGRWQPLIEADQLPARGWFPRWVNGTIAIEPPEVVRARYARIRH